MKRINFKSGKVVYNEFHIDFSKSFVEQIESLTEDLLQVEYSNRYLLDLGWYPEYDENGYFQVLIIENGNWQVPLYIQKCREWEDLKHYITCAVEMLESYI